ncbi:MAG: hypothetical protein ACE5I3_06540, partial [Phycisphaerae bacterium]
MCARDKALDGCPEPALAVIRTDNLARVIAFSCTAAAIDIINSDSLQTFEQLGEQVLYPPGRARARMAGTRDTFGAVDQSPKRERGVFTGRRLA